MSFKKYLANLKEETTSGDIATVDTKMGFNRRDKHRSKGNKCSQHSRLNCAVCESKLEENWN